MWACSPVGNMLNITWELNCRLRTQWKAVLVIAMRTPTCIFLGFHFHALIFVQVLTSMLQGSHVQCRHLSLLPFAPLVIACKRVLNLHNVKGIPAFPKFWWCQSCEFFHIRLLWGWCSSCWMKMVCQLKGKCGAGVQWHWFIKGCAE